MNEHETTADIITWLRRPREGENAYLTLWRDEIADRLEAAHKRELSKNASKNGADFGQLGDAAKLREALSKSCAYFAVVLNTGMFNRVHLEALLNMAKAALAAPARNCDIYLTEEAVDAATVTVRNCQACSRIDMEAPCVFCMVRWLLAPAKEGGAK